MNTETHRKLSIGRAMNEGMAQAMRANPAVFVMREDIRYFGGVRGHTGELLEEFGRERVHDTLNSGSKHWR